MEAKSEREEKHEMSKEIHDLSTLYLMMEEV